MIGKKIPNPKKTASKAERASGLSDYILCRDEPHKLLYAGARGFLSATEAGHVAEMIALATDAVRSRDPISHYVLSWRENERPSAQQIEQAIDIFETETGLVGHQLTYGLHHDTDNLHLHIAVNRAHPVTGRVIKVNGGFDIEAIHRVVARVEAAQGWAREANGRYAIDHAGELTKVSPERGQAKRTPSTQAQDYEARTGSKSAERIAQEQAAPIMRQATTWAELHAGLAAQGMRYERKGSGAVLWVGAQPVKASTADRAAAIGKLEARLGPFEPAQAAIARQVERPPEPMPGGRSEWNHYAAERQDRRAAKRAAWSELRKRQGKEHTQLAQDQARERSTVLAGDWRGNGAVLNALRSALAADHAAAKLELRDQHTKQRTELREQHPPVRDFQTWRRQQGYERPIIGRIDGLDHVPLTPRPDQDIRAFVGVQDGYRVAYMRQDEPGGDVAFVDQGRQIKVFAADDAAVLAALQLGEQRFRGSAGMVVNGTEAFKAQSVRLAVQHGIKIANPELQQAIEAERANQAREASPQHQAEPGHAHDTDQERGQGLER